MCGFDSCCPWLKRKKLHFLHTKKHGSPLNVSSFNAVRGVAVGMSKVRYVTRMRGKTTLCRLYRLGKHRGSSKFRSQLRLFNTLYTQQSSLNSKHFYTSSKNEGVTNLRIVNEIKISFYFFKSLIFENLFLYRPTFKKSGEASLPSIYFTYTKLPSYFFTNLETCRTLRNFGLQYLLGGNAGTRPFWQQVQAPFSNFELNSVGTWFFLKRRLKHYVTPSQSMLLGYGSKHFILQNSIFYPHGENVTVFKNLIFYSRRAATEERAVSHLVSCASLLNTVMRLKCSRRTIPVLAIHTVFFQKLRKIFVSLKKLRRRLMLRSRKYRLTRHSRYRPRVFKVSFGRFFSRIKRIRRKVVKSKILIRRFLVKIRRKLTRSYPARVRTLDRYELPNFLSFNLRNYVARRGIKSELTSYNNKALTTTNFLFFPPQKESTGVIRTSFYFSKEHSITSFFFNPTFFKTFLPQSFLLDGRQLSVGYSWLTLLSRSIAPQIFPISNLIPLRFFRSIMSKKILSNQTNSFLSKHAVPWAHTSLIRFMEQCSGKKIFVQFYSFITQNVDPFYLVIYRRWMPRMRYYEQRLGHKFFLGEALSIIHLSFTLHDPKLLISWFSAIIKRISFWKTRLVFRFFRYLIHNYFSKLFLQLNIKGIKVRLKGKISVSGNSRKRAILYRAGVTSHSTTSLKVLHESTLINTFTGVMGFQIWLFY